MNLNQVTYGNPTQEQKKIIDEVSIVDDLYLKLKEDFFPPNDSELVKDELNELVDLTKSIVEDSNKAFLTRYKAYDRSLSQVITTTFKQKGIDVDSLCLDIIEDIKSLILKLK
jgi:hypothetical protein